MKLDRVTKRFGGLVAVNEVSLEIGQGELIGIVGPNGSGKTTLYNLISGIYHPDEGRIFFEGRDITELPPYKRAHLGIARTFQISRPFGSATVRENVAVGALFGSLHGRIDVEEAIEVADRYLELVGLSSERDKPAGTLTPVEKKLMEIARALAMRPKLLLIDEAMAGMHPRDIDKLVAFLRRVRDEEEIAIVAMVEHIMRAVVGMADRVMVMHQGRKLVDASTAEALRDKRVVDIYLGRPMEEA